eukprot:3023240-Pleurochrysis_carterae.AAC.1
MAARDSELRGEIAVSRNLRSPGLFCVSILDNLASSSDLQPNNCVSWTGFVFCSVFRHPN